MIFLAVSLALATSSLLLVVVKHLYDYLQDPKGLRRFPGMNILAPFTNLPYMYFASRGNKFKVLHDAHQKYGPIVRVGPTSVSFNDAVGFKNIYGHGSAVTKGEFYDILSGSHRHLADVSNREEHARKRRVLAGAYSQAGLERWEHIVADRTAALVKQYDRLCSKPVYQPTIHALSSPGNTSFDGYINHRHWMILFSQDAIAQIGLAADLKLLEAGHDTVDFQDSNGKQRRFSYREALWRSHRIQTSLVWSPRWFNWLATLSGWHPYWAANTNYTHMCVDLVKRRLARSTNGEKLNDFFSYILQDKYDKANMYPFGEMVAETSIMLNAGSDTTGIALTNALFWLLKNPSAFAKLRAELDFVLDPKEAVAPYDKVKHLPWLRACLDESMRLTPPNTMSASRLTPSEGMEIMGHWIPGHTTVHSPPYAMHRNHQVFPDPEAFKPERWLAENAKDLQPHFITFSGGSRGCIGRNITYLEQTLALASLVHRYDFELPSQDFVLGQTESFTCSPSDMPVKIRRRLFETEH